MAVMPFFVMLILQPFVDLAPGDGLEEGGGTGAGLGTVASFIRAVRLVRLFRIFKLASGMAPHGFKGMKRRQKER